MAKVNKIAAIAALSVLGAVRLVRQCGLSMAQAAGTSTFMNLLLTLLTGTPGAARLAEQGSLQVSRRRLGQLPEGQGILVPRDICVTTAFRTPSDRVSTVEHHVWYRTGSRPMKDL
jgi:ABC-type uncharacterized transport system ATPase subunit